MSRKSRSCRGLVIGRLSCARHYEVTQSGWCTLQHDFYDDGGVLAVDLNLLDRDGNLLFTETRSSADDTIDDLVGGNRYGWFTHIGVAALAVDNSQLSLTEPQAVPGPSSLAALAGMLGIGGLIAFRRRRRRVS